MTVNIFVHNTIKRLSFPKGSFLLERDWKMKKLIFALALVMLSIITGCGKETHTVSEEDNGTGTYKVDIVEEDTGEYEVDLKEDSWGEMSYFEQHKAMHMQYLNETLPSFLQSITNQTGMTFTSTYEEVENYHSRIEVEFHRNGNTMSDYDLKHLLPNLDPYNDSFVPDINIHYSERDEEGDRVRFN